ncbi:MAG: LysM peptidoglycan-binding domain-containing protein [Emcibacter sp.]|nr:LysM peptidoglycan-binding domain-containing protein [Emcibacter sp.]
MMCISQVLSACQEGHSYSTRYQNGIPASKYAKNNNIKPKKMPKQSHKTEGNIVVVKGDTLYSLSRRHDVSVRAIIEHNNLKPPYLLYPGQKLHYPSAAVYVVKKGDTVYSLSRIYNIDMTNFTRLNNIKHPYVLTIGQTLKVPRTDQKNKITSPKKAFISPPPPQSGLGFMWPIKGPLLSSFGPKDKGYHNDGINIAAKLGSYVMASESGIVVHTGNKIKGFGNLILIKHSNGWITAYAHNADILVNKGQTVKRGQVIARVGQSGDVNRPQLHFEMRKASRAVDPKLFLKG